MRVPPAEVTRDRKYLVLPLAHRCGQIFVGMALMSTSGFCRGRALAFACSAHGWASETFSREMRRISRALQAFKGRVGNRGH